MQPLETDVKIAWKLVAQFVSWDFCRYICQQSDSNKSETDVLTFLRNMFVERTEKMLSEVTKQELVAKLVLEAKAARSATRLPALAALSRNVAVLCPELAAHLPRLLRRLESLLNVLDGGSECGDPELVTLRLESEVSAFTREACRLLPPPDVLQMIQEWGHRHAALGGSRKVLHNPRLFEKVVRCLRMESIDAMEARLIAVAVCEDELLQSMVLQADSETEPDSEPFSLSLMSQTCSQTSQECPPFSPRKPALPPDGDCPLRFTQSPQVEEEFDPAPPCEEEGEAPDTSDCDADNTVRFLTPTFYREEGEAPAEAETASLDDSGADPTWGKAPPKESPQKKSPPRKNPPKKSPPRKSPRSRAPEKIKRLFPGIQDYFEPNRATRLDDIPEVAEEVEVVTTMAAPAPPAPGPSGIVRRRKATPSSAQKGGARCRVCGRTFKTRVALGRHVFLKHPDPAD